MSSIYRDRSFDATLSMLRNPYGFIAEKCQRYQTDLFQTRIVLRPTICMTGRDAAQLLYDESRFTRAGSMPAWAKSVLFGRGGVQGLDGEAHRHRKQLHLNIITPPRVAELGTLVARWLSEYARLWALLDRVTLYEQFKEVMLRAVCQWAGVPLVEGDVRKRTQQISSLYEHAMSVGLKRWQAGRARRALDRWAAEIIEDIRAQRLTPPESTAAHLIAHHRDLQGDLLDREVAAVELLNILRPTVAVSVFMTLLGLALHEFADCRSDANDDEADAKMFIQEVRRFYPFFPFVSAKVCQTFRWREFEFPEGQRVMLDVFGSNHDPRHWEHPQQFRPERFRSRVDDPFGFIPQGGGDPSQHHRCPGEPIAIEVMKVALNFLTRQITYVVPRQELSLNLSRVPALPSSGIVIQDVSLRGELLANDKAAIQILK